MASETAAVLWKHEEGEILLLMATHKWKEGRMKIQAANEKKEEKNERNRNCHTRECLFGIIFICGRQKCVLGRRNFFSLTDERI